MQTKEGEGRPIGNEAIALGLFGCENTARCVCTLDFGRALQAEIGDRTIAIAVSTAGFPTVCSYAIT